MSAYPVISGPMTLLGAGKPSSGGGCADANVIAWKAAVVGAGGSVSGTKETQVCDLVNNLKGNGGPHSGTNLFATKDRIWLFAADNVQQATYDLVAASAVTNSGSSWAATTGWTGNGSSSFVDTNFLNNGGTNFLQNSAAVTVCVLNNRTASANKEAVGATDTISTGNTSRFFPYAAGDSIIYPLNVSGNSFDQFASGVGTARGLWTTSRTASTTTNLYRNANSTSLNTSAATSGATYAISFYVGAGNIGAGGEFFSDDNIGAVAFGSGPTGANAVLFHTDINTHMAAAGASCF